MGNETMRLADQGRVRAAWRGERWEELSEVLGWRGERVEVPPRAWLGGVSYDGGTMAWRSAAGTPSPLRADERGVDAARARWRSMYFFECLCTAVSCVSSATA